MCIYHFNVVVFGRRYHVREDLYHLTSLNVTLMQCIVKLIQKCAAMPTFVVLFFGGIVRKGPLGEVILIYGFLPESAVSCGFLRLPGA